MLVVFIWLLLLDIHGVAIQLDTMGWLEAAFALEKFWVVLFYSEQGSNFIRMFDEIADHFAGSAHLKFGRGFCPSQWGKYLKNVETEKNETGVIDRKTGGENHAKTYKLIFTDKKDLFRTTKAARGMLPTIIDMIKPKSVCDVGCGTAAWLRTVQDITGINDSDATAFDFGVPLESLMVKPSQYRDVNLLYPLKHERQYELCMTIEVAEHLEECAADIFVQSLVSLSPVILFSAAPPGLGGIHHVNERWITYWEEKFREHGYYGFDFWRPRIWYGDFWWHVKQDAVLFVREDRFSSLNFSRPNYPILPVIHPNHGIHKKRINPMKFPFEKEQKKVGEMCESVKPLDEPVIKLFYKGSSISYNGEFTVNAVKKWIIESQAKEIFILANATVVDL